MRIGFSIKELAEILEIDAKRVGQSVDPAMQKLAKLWMRNPTKTILFLMDTVQTLQRARRNELSMSEDEIDERICMLKGRYDGPRHMADIATGRAVHPNDVRL